MQLVKEKEREAPTNSFRGMGSREAPVSSSSHKRRGGRPHLSRGLAGRAKGDRCHDLMVRPSAKCLALWGKPYLSRETFHREGPGTLSPTLSKKKLRAESPKAAEYTEEVHLSLWWGGRPRNGECPGGGGYSNQNIPLGEGERLILERERPSGRVGGEGISSERGGKRGANPFF